MRAALVMLLSIWPVALLASDLPVIPEKTVQAFAAELSGEAAKRNLEAISRQHRMRASKQYRASADHIVGELKRYGYADAFIDEFAVDGEIFYGTQRSRPAWNVDFAELWEVGESGDRTRIADWNSEPLTVAQDSASGEATGLLVDIGAGTAESDYAGKELRGKFALTSSQPSAVVALAVKKHGAAAIISYAQNQRTAWWGEDENLIRWGHLDTFSDTPTFAFMVTLKQARDFQRRLRAGEEVKLQGSVRAASGPGHYAIPTATIPGSDRSLAGQEIIYSCHLDHPRPGANDNASGCATILEIARTFKKLIDEKRIEPPRRTIRFVWPAEIEGTLALLNARPDFRRAAKAAIHLDMVGGGPETRAMFHVTRGPASLPSFVHDIAAAVGAFANEQTARLAMTGSSPFPMTANGGGKEALQARFVPYTPGSDHDVYNDSSFAIPAVYLNDWPDRYIHTNADTAANIDPSKLERAAFIAGATGLILANLSAEDRDAVMEVVTPASVERAAVTMRRMTKSPAAARDNIARFAKHYEGEVVASLDRFLESPATEGQRPKEYRTRAARPYGETAMLDTLLVERGAVPKPRGAIYRRNPSLLGPMSAFGYDYLDDHLGADASAKLLLPQFKGGAVSGSEYAYEALNFVDGRRTTSEIRDALSAIYGDVPLATVEEYLAALQKAGVIAVK
jgi:aminopeptidase YwaD